jgi:hypothetical protein
MMNDLFSYPHFPGSKEPTTSRDAAEKIAPRARTLRDQVLTALSIAWPGGMTADEVARAIGKTEFSVRPRLSELRADQQIIPTDIRRPNASGVDAIVWVVVRSQIPEESE